MLIRLILSKVSLIDLTFSKLALLRIETSLQLQESSLFYCTLPCLKMSIGQKIAFLNFFAPKKMNLIIFNLIFCQNEMFFINLMVNYDQTVPKLHVNINILMKKHHILTLYGIAIKLVQHIYLP
jgi:hypothetical protein